LGSTANRSFKTAVEDAALRFDFEGRGGYAVRLGEASGDALGVDDALRPLLGLGAALANAFVAEVAVVALLFQAGEAQRAA